MAAALRAAFFDVDGTLTARTTLFDFLAFEMARRGLPPDEYRAARERLAALTAAGAPRTATNREYFRLFADRSAAELAGLGRAWFHAALAEGGFFLPEALAAYRGHRRRGELTVLVSGSFAPCVEPIAARLGADAVLCTRPEIRAGRYTGRVRAPMVDDEKARAVRRLARTRGLDLARCYGYADHVSDLPFLRTVGHPAVVGGDPRMRAEAERNGWSLIEPGPAFADAARHPLQDGPERRTTGEAT